MGFPGGSPAKSGDVGSIPLLERSTGKGIHKAFQYSSGKCHGQRSLVGYGPWSYRRVRQVLATKQQQQKAPLSQRHIIFFIYCSIQLANILFRLLLLLLFSHPVVSYSLQHHGLQQPRPPCPSSSSRVLPFMFIASVMPSNHFTLWHPPFHLCSIFPASGTFPVNRLFASDDQNTGASASILPVNIRGWSHLRLTGLISLLFKGLLQVFSSTIFLRHQFFGILPSLQLSSHNHMWPLGRPLTWLYRPLSAE